jgi:hypothetical protein
MRKTKKPLLFLANHRPTLLCVSAMIVLLLASCGPKATPAAQEQAIKPVATNSPIARVTSTATVSTADGSGSVETPLQLVQDEMVILRSRQGPNRWTWQTSLPGHRLVVFYGNPLSSVMGPIGQYSDDELIAKLQEQAQAYAQLDPAHPVVPALDYVTPIVQPVPMHDGSWVYRMPDDSIEHYVDLANENHALFFFDMQIGHSTLQKEVNLVWNYLKRPGVDLTLDPEFDMPPGAIPDQVFGHMSAAEINWAIDKLSHLVLSQHLPPKILIIHQFRESMLPDWQNIKVKPGVQVITCVDGFGTPSEKIDDYRIFDKEQLIQYPGMKLFYKLDVPLMSPGNVLALKPPPLMVMYQ